MELYLLFLIRLHAADRKTFTPIFIAIFRMCFGITSAFVFSATVCLKQRICKWLSLCVLFNDAASC